MLREAEQAYESSNKFLRKAKKSRASRTITRRELARAVASACSFLPQTRAGALVDEVLEEISTALISGENVTLCNFGKFVLVERKERTGRNPRTGALAIVLPRRVASFRPSRYLKAAIAKNIGRVGVKG
ncbi:HU family DNA-binding protein [Methylocystis sp. S23]|jgi:integration host factor subunit alpha